MTAAATASRFRPGPRHVAALLGAVVVLLVAASVPLAVAAHQLTLADVLPVTVLALAFAVVGVVVAGREPHNPLGWLLASVGLLAVLNDDGSLYAVLDYRLGRGLPLGPVAAVLELSWLPLITVLPLAVLLFPDGRLPSRRWQWLLGAYAVIGAVYVVAAAVVAGGVIASHRIEVSTGGGLVAIERPAGWFAVTTQVISIAFVACWVLFVLRQVLSWRRADGERRQQLKWLMSGAAVCLAGGSLIVLGSALDPNASPAVTQAISSLGTAAVIGLPVGVGVGILKYRLYEIDRIISRTLAYAVVTGLLAGVYVALVLLATRALSVSSQVAVAASTLAAAALFNPLRRRVQRMVDRRFNRARYNADKTVAAFAAHLKDAVDLDSVRDDLASVVRKALEPAHVSVWISQRD